MIKALALLAFAVSMTAIACLGQVEVVEVPVTVTPLPAAALESSTPTWQEWLGQQIAAGKCPSAASTMHFRNEHRDPPYSADFYCQKPTPTPDAVATRVAATVEAISPTARRPAATPGASLIPVSAPTATPRPTATPWPTATPRPLPTQVQAWPTPTPTPQPPPEYLLAELNWIMAIDTAVCTSSGGTNRVEKLRTDVGESTPVSGWGEYNGTTWYWEHHCDIARNATIRGKVDSAEHPGHLEVSGFPDNWKSYKEATFALYWNEDGTWESYIDCVYDSGTFIVEDVRYTPETEGDWTIEWSCQTPARPTPTPHISLHPPALPPQIHSLRAPEPERDWDEEADSFIRGSGWCYRGDETRRRLLAMPWVRDGVTQTEYETLSTIFGFNCANWPDGELDEDGWEMLLELAETPGIKDQALLRAIGMGTTYGRNSIEEIIYRTDVDSRIMWTHHSPALTISIVREGETADDQTADWIRYAVAFNEWLMGEPLPLSHLVVFIEDLSESPGTTVGTNHGDGYECAPEHGPRDRDQEFQGFRDCLIHETAHFWWTGESSWLDEGMATMVEYIANEHAGTLHEHSVNQRSDCTVPDLQTLTEIDPTPDEWDAYKCSYYLGQALFLELYKGLGTVDDIAQFALKARHLYDEVETAWREKAEQIDYDWTEYEDWYPDYPALLRAAFPGQDAVIDRHWNGG